MRMVRLYCQGKAKIGYKVICIARIYTNGEGVSILLSDINRKGKRKVSESTGTKIAKPVAKHNPQQLNECPVIVVAGKGVDTDEPTPSYSTQRKAKGDRKSVV